MTRTEALRLEREASWALWGFWALSDRFAADLSIGGSIHESRGFSTISSHRITFSLRTPTRRGAPTRHGRIGMGQQKAQGDADTRSICPACNTLYDRSVFVCERCGTGLLEIPDAPLLSGSTLDLRYDIEGVVGTGGMGTVYRARQRGMEREVAVKVLHPRYAHDPRAVKRFFREAQAASRLIHPHVVTVYDFGRSVEGHLYMVMELLEGSTLGDLIHYRAPLPPAFALSILSQICDALEEAHRQRLVHRDLKPDNVLLTSHDEGPWAKVLDFGIARMFREPGDGPGLERHHSTVEIAGTPAYMSPEQILGKEPDPRSDLYSLGIILFEMLTRRRPFEDENSVALCMKQLNEQPSRISPTQQVSEPVERLVRGLLEKKPEDRPQRARDVKALIAACPESSYPFSLPEIAPQAPRGIGERPTRAEVMFTPDQRTADLPPIQSQREFQARPEVPHTQLVAPKVAPAAAPREAKRLGRSAPETVKEVRESRHRKPPVAIAVILTEHAGALGSGELATWLQAKEKTQAEVTREDRRATVKVFEGSPLDALRALAVDALALQERSLAQNLGLRIGLAEVGAQGPTVAADVARRLAAATTHGQVAVSSAIAQRAGLAIRPQTSVFMPDGGALEAAVLRRAMGEQDEDAAGLLWGRGLQLRRLGQIGDEAMRQGPTTALIQGARGMGKSAVLAAFAQGRNAVQIRVSPLAANHPGHTLAALVAAAVGTPLRGRPGDLDRLDKVDLSDRSRELLELLLLDRPVTEVPSVKGWARFILELLNLRAGEGALVVAIDDAHFLDRASQEVLSQVVKLAEKRPWTFVATARALKPETFLADGARLDLRPLGLRAMNQLGEELKVPPRQRHGMLAAAQGNPATLRLLARLMQSQPHGDLPAQVHQLGEGLLPWLLTGLLRAADSREADRAWREASLGEAGTHEDALVAAARLYLERELPKDLGRWLADRLTREGPVPEALGRGLREHYEGAAEKRAQRCERLGLYRLAALELEATLGSLNAADKAQVCVEIAQLKAQAGDLAGAVQSFDAAARVPGERRSTAMLRFARALLDLGDKERAADVLDIAEESVLQRREAKPMGEWLVLRAKASLVRGDLAGTGHALQRARDVADQLARTDARASRGLQALVQETRAELALATGDREAARTNFRQARDAFRDLGQNSDSMRCLVALGEVELAMRDFRRAADTFRAASRMAAASGLGREEVLAEIGLGETELALGDLDEGCQRLRGAFRRVSVDDEDGTLGARAALGMGHAMLARRLFADVFRYTERARQQSRSPGVLARIHVCEAEAHLGEQQQRRAMKSLDLALEAARHTADALLIERIRQLRQELERAGHAGEPASAVA
jgi:serine/threonine protein kinase/tetratricopeptide (TPR) repeat protein